MKIIKWAGVVTAGLVAGALTTAPATASDWHYAAAPWAVLDTVDDAQAAAAHSTIDAERVTLRWKKNQTDGHGGTSAETADLGLPVEAGTKVSVEYRLSHGASWAGGAVRLFIYLAPNQDTLTTAPAAFVAAESNRGTLTLTVPEDGEIGTLGVVYDTSNSAAGGVSGKVTFKRLTVDYQRISFGPAPVDPPVDPPADPPAEEEEGGEVPPPVAGDEQSDPPGGEAGEETLPVTGSPLVVLLTTGLAAIAAGGGTLALSRFRRRRF